MAGETNELVFGYHDVPSYRDALNELIGRVGFGGAITDDPQDALKLMNANRRDTRGLILPIGPISSEEQSNVTRNPNPAAVLSRSVIAKEVPWVLIGLPGQDPNAHILYASLAAGSTTIVPEADGLPPEQQIAKKLALWLLDLP